MKAQASLAGAVTTSVLAHLPCCMPGILAAGSGAATSGVAALGWLETFRPALLALSAGLIIWSFWCAYRPQPSCSCADHSQADHRQERTIKVVSAWAALGIFVLGLIVGQTMEATQSGAHDHKQEAGHTHEVGHAHAPGEIHAH
jgi:hypothetical protein